MSIELVSPALIDPNPFNPRLVADPARVAEIAASIKVHGLLQEPQARLVRTPNGDRFQLAFGHTRLAAWKQARGNEAMPLDVRTLTDVQMSVHGFLENTQRGDLTQIEKARWIEMHMGKFKVSQAQIAKEIEYEAATVSNLLRLLSLPKPIQDLMLKGLPERLARQLIPLSKVHVKEATIIADKVFRADESEREPLLHRELSQIYWSNLARRMKMATFAPDWKPPQVKIGDGLEPPMPTACNGCPFHIKFNNDAYCLRPECMDAKNAAWVEVEAERVAKKLDIPNAGTKVNGVVPLAVSWNSEAELKAAVATKDPALRLIPASPTINEAGQYHVSREAALGSASVILGAKSAADAERIQALVKAELKRADKVKGKSTRDLLDEARNKREQAARREAFAYIKRAAPQLTNALLPVGLPQVLLNAMFTEWKYEFPDGHDKALAQFKANQREAVTLAFVCKQAPVTRYGTVKVSEVRAKVQALAKALKVKLENMEPQAKAGKTKTNAKAKRSGAPKVTKSKANKVKAKQ